MIIVEGKGGIKATVVAHSKSSVNGKEIITFELEYHRYIHSEFMTHRVFSRNAASSRAIPVDRMIELVENSPATPIHWGKNKPGMQARDECNNFIGGDCEYAGLTREEAWLEASELAIIMAKQFKEAGYHKQIVNRILEPYQMIKVVCTATEYDNFFYLRNDEEAQPEIAALAQCMWEARKQSVPEILYPGEWHTPYVEHFRDGNRLCYGNRVSETNGIPVFEKEITLEEALKISSSCCAQVSYRKLDDSLDKAIDIYNRMVTARRVHASPFEHQAAPMEYPNEKFTYIYDIGSYPEVESGVTHVDMNGDYWSGNFKSWIQHRQLIPNHVCKEYKEE